MLFVKWDVALPPTHQIPVDGGSVYELPAWYLTRGRHPSDPMWERTQWRKWLLNGFSRGFKCVCSQKDIVKNSQLSMDDFIRISSMWKSKVTSLPLFAGPENWELMHCAHESETQIWTKIIHTQQPQGRRFSIYAFRSTWVEHRFCPSFILLLW